MIADLPPVPAIVEVIKEEAKETTFTIKIAETEKLLANIKKEETKKDPPIAPPTTPAIDYTPFDSIATTNAEANVRTGPSIDHPLNPTYTPNGILGIGVNFKVTGYKTAQDPYNNGNSTWVRSQYGNWVWAKNLSLSPAIPGTLPSPAAPAPAPVPAPAASPPPAPTAQTWSGLKGSIGRALAYGNCVNEPGVNNPGWGNPIDWPITSSQPYIGATALWTYNHTGVVVGIWDNGDLEIRHQNFQGNITRFPQSTFRGYR